jgi:hypothetical protein
MPFPGSRSQCGATAASTPSGRRRRRTVNTLVGRSLHAPRLLRFTRRVIRILRFSNRLSSYRQIIRAYLRYHQGSLCRSRLRSLRRGGRGGNLVTLPSKALYGQKLDLQEFHNERSRAFIVGRAHALCRLAGENAAISGVLAQEDLGWGITPLSALVSSAATSCTSLPSTGSRSERWRPCPKPRSQPEVRCNRRRPQRRHTVGQSMPLHRQQSNLAVEYCEAICTTLRPARSISMSALACPHAE